MIQVLVTIAVLGLMMLMGFGVMAVTCMFTSRPISEPLDEREERTAFPQVVRYIEQ